MPSVLHGEAQRVRNLGLLDRFVITHQTGKDRQTRGIGRSPARRPQCIRVQIERRTTVGIPTRAAVDWEGVTQLIKLPMIAIDDQHVTIATRIWPTLDGSIRRDRIRTRIAFIAVSREVDRDERLRSGNDDVRNAVRRAIVDGAEVCMQSRVQADARNQIR